MGWGVTVWGTWWDWEGAQASSPLPRKTFWIFILKLWVLVHSHSAACFTRIREFHTYLYTWNWNLLVIVSAFWELWLLPVENCGLQVTKMGQKLIKKCAKIVLFFCTFSVFILLKFLRVMDWGAIAPSSPPWLRPCTQNLYRIYYFNDFRAILVCWHVAEIFWSSWGPRFCGGPVWPNMLNMPKPASGSTLVICSFMHAHFCLTG